MLISELDDLHHAIILRYDSRNGCYGMIAASLRRGC
jgi:hypothetical protein